jgi:hypothetical protein
MLPYLPIVFLLIIGLLGLAALFLPETLVARINNQVLKGNHYVFLVLGENLLTLDLVQD